MWQTYKTNFNSKHYSSFHDIRAIKTASTLMINKHKTVKECLTLCTPQAFNYILKKTPISEEWDSSKLAIRRGEKLVARSNSRR